MIKNYKNYIFFYIYYSTKKEVLCVFNYQKKEIYKEYPEIYHAYEQIIINDNNENLIKIIYLINYDSIGVFNFHSGELLNKIKIEIIPIKNKVFTNDNHYDSIYNLAYWNDNYIILSYGKVIEADVKYGSYGRRDPYDKRCYSIEVINSKEQKMKQIFKLTTVDNSIFIKKIFHPKYGDCLLTRDSCGEIKIIKIKL